MRLVILVFLAKALHAEPPHPGEPRPVANPANVQATGVAAFEDWVKGLCPQGTQFSQGELGVQTRKAILLFTLSQLEGLAAERPQSSEAKQVRELVFRIRPEILGDRFSVAKGAPQWVFGESFASEFFTAPYFYLGELARAYRNYLDLTDRELGYQSGTPRFTKTHESRGYWQQAGVVRLLPETVSQNDMRFQKILAAAAKGENSNEWVTLLGEELDIDLSLRHRLEKQFWDTAFTKHRRQMLTDDVAPLVSEIMKLAILQHEQAMELQKDAHRKTIPEGFRKRFVTLATFVQSLEDFKDDWGLFTFSSKDGSPDDKTRTVLTENIKAIRKIHDEIENHPHIAPLLKKAASPLNRTSLLSNAFADWSREFQGQKEFERAARKALCDTQGRSRKALWEREIHSEAPDSPPKLPGTDPESLKTEKTKRLAEMKAIDMFFGPRHALIDALKDLKDEEAELNGPEQWWVRRSEFREKKQILRDQLEQLDNGEGPSVDEIQEAILKTPTSQAEVAADPERLKAVEKRFVKSLGRRPSEKNRDAVLDAYDEMQKSPSPLTTSRCSLPLLFGEVSVSEALSAFGRAPLNKNPLYLYFNLLAVEANYDQRNRRTLVPGVARWLRELQGMPDPTPLQKRMADIGNAEMRFYLGEDWDDENVRGAFLMMDVADGDDELFKSQIKKVYGLSDATQDRAIALVRKVSSSRAKKIERALGKRFW